MKALLYKLIAGFCRIYTALTSKDSAPVPLDQIHRGLIIMTHGLGDTGMFMPALAALKENLPGVELDLCISSSAVGLIGGEWKGGRVYICKPESTLKELLGLIRTFRERHYDLALVGVVAPGIEDAAILAAFSGAKFRLGPTNKPVYTHIVQIKADEHDVDQNLGLLTRYLFPNAMYNRFPRLSVDEATRLEARAYLERYSQEGPRIGMHPGGQKTDEFKRWPQEHFARLGDILAQRFQARIIIFEGPDELGLAREIRTHMRVAPTLICQRSLQEVMAYLKECDLLITSDSGLGHLAAAIGVPVVSIFGPANERRTAPYGEAEKVVARDVWCRPCYHTHGRCFRERRFCLEDLSAEEVVAKVKLVLLKKGFAETSFMNPSFDKSLRMEMT